jgi:nicotinamidase-related amidase
VREPLPGPALSSEFELRPDTGALLVVDMQRVAADPELGVGGYLAQHDPQVHDYIYERVRARVTPNIRRLQERFRDLGRPVVFVVNGSSAPDFSDYLPLRRGRVRDVGFIPRVGSAEYEILQELRPMPEELVILKRSTSAFSSTGLDQILRNMGITDLVTVGVATDACVGLTARDAADRGYGVVLVEDATATYTPQRHESFLSLFATVHGNVMTTDEVVGRLAQADTSPLT